MRWGLRRTCSPAGNRRGRAPAPAPPAAGAARGRNGVRGLFRETGAAGTGGFGVRPPALRPAPLPGGSPAPSAAPLRGPGGAFRCCPQNTVGGCSRGTARPRRSGWPVPPLPCKRGSPLKRLPGKGPGGVTGGDVGSAAGRKGRGGGGGCEKPRNSNLKRLFAAHPRHPWAGDISNMVKGFTLPTGELSPAVPTPRPGLEPSFSGGLQ